MSLIQSLLCELVFYTNPHSRGQIARWMLEETQADYRQILLDYGSSMKAGDYLKINPMGKVPAIVHCGHVVTECAAICAYLADAFPEAQLAPDIRDRASYYRWLFFASGPLESAIVNRSLGVEVKDDQQRMVGYGNYQQVIDVLAAKLGSSKFITGEQFTAADVYVGSHVIWGMQFGSMPKRSEFEDYASRLVIRKAYQDAKTIDENLDG